MQLNLPWDYPSFFGYPCLPRSRPLFFYGAASSICLHPVNDNALVLLIVMVECETSINNFIVRVCTNNVVVTGFPLIKTLKTIAVHNEQFLLKAFEVSRVDLGTASFQFVAILYLVIVVLVFESPREQMFTEKSSTRYHFLLCSFDGMHIGEFHI